jgi:hypothetical protein
MGVAILFFVCLVYPFLKLFYAGCLLGIFSTPRGNLGDALSQGKIGHTEKMFVFGHDGRIG